MGPLSYMRSVVDRNVMRRLPVQSVLSDGNTLLHLGPDDWA
jgi:hypothetical protein